MTIFILKDNREVPWRRPAGGPVSARASADELAALREENQKLRDREGKWLARNQKTKAMQAKVAERFKQLLAQNARSAAKGTSAGEVAEAGEELLRSHQMTLSIMHQYRDYCLEVEATLVTLRRKYELACDQLQYFQARNAQLKALATSLLVHSKEQGLLQEGSPLSQLVKNVREAHPVPAHSEQDWEQRILNAGVVTEDQLPKKCASLQERVREFEHFLEGKKADVEQKRVIVRQKSGGVLSLSASGERPLSLPESPPPVGGVGGPSLSLIAHRDRQISLAAAAPSSKAAQTLGLEHSQSSQIKLSTGTPTAKRRQGIVASKEGQIAAQRAHPTQFPFTEWPTVRHVQFVVSLLGSAKPRPPVPTQQIDSIREEANRLRPNVEWLIQELSPHLAGAKGPRGIAIGSRLRLSTSDGCLSFKLDPEWRTDSGESLLHVLVAHDDAAKLIDEMVKRYGFSGNELDLNGVSSFLYACMYSTPCAQRLLKLNPSLLKQSCCEDLTPLHVAALYGNVSCCKMLLELGCAVEVDRNGASPAVYALLNDKPEALSFFASRVSAQSCLADTMGNTPALLACCVSSKEVVRELLRAGAQPAVANHLGISPLWMALQTGNTPVLNELLAVQAVELDRGYGPFLWTLLQMSIVFLPETRAVAALKTLLAHGANPNSTNMEKKTALFYALILDRVEVLRVLLDSGADANMKDAFDNRPLHFCQSVQAVSLLVSSGAKINVRNRAGNTALHHACLFQNMEVAKVLVSSGCSENTVNELGEGPSDMSSKYTGQIAIPFFESDLASTQTGGVVLTPKQ